VFIYQDYIEEETLGPLHRAALRHAKES